MWYLPTFLSTAPSMTCLAYCALLELFLLYMLSCYNIWSGNYPRKYLLGSGNMVDELVQLMMTMRT